MVSLVLGTDLRNGIRELNKRKQTKMVSLILGTDLRNGIRELNKRKQKW
jgi:hypothetical protein